MSYLQAEVTSSGDLGWEALYKPPKACVMGEAGVRSAQDLFASFLTLRAVLC